MHSILIAADLNNSVRQLAFIDAQGQSVSWTGSKNIAAAGSQCGPMHAPPGSSTVPGQGMMSVAGGTGGSLCVGSDFAAQANLMSNDKVWPAKASQESKGDLAERMAALDAAQAVGGDIRGRQSAALIVAEGKRQNAPWEGRIFNLRVDDAAEPLKKLRRLVVLQSAYNHMNAGDLAVEHKDNEAALREYAVVETIASNTPGILPSRLAEMIFWHAVALVTMNRVDDALPLFKKCFTIERSGAELTSRLPAAGLLPNDPKLIERIVAQANP